VFTCPPILSGHVCSYAGARPERCVCQPLTVIWFRSDSTARRFSRTTVATTTTQEVRQRRPPGSNAPESHLI
jgi:hypothetical protein